MSVVRTLAFHCNGKPAAPSDAAVRITTSAEMSTLASVSVIAPLAVSDTSPNVPAVMAPSEIAPAADSVTSLVSSSVIDVSTVTTVIGESSAMLIAPAVAVAVRLPKLVVSPTLSPSVIEVPLRVAAPLTGSVVLAASVIAAVELSDSVTAPFPANTCNELSSAIVTDPELLMKLMRPKLIRSPTWLPKSMPVPPLTEINEASDVTDKLAPAVLLMLPAPF